MIKNNKLKIAIIILIGLIPNSIISQNNLLDEIDMESMFKLATSFNQNLAAWDVRSVKIMGESNILNKLPTSASNLYAKNVFNFVSNLFDKEKSKIDLNLEDEIIEKTLIK